MTKASPKAIDGWIHRYLAGYSTVELGVPVTLVSDTAGLTVYLEDKSEPSLLYEATWPATPTRRKTRGVSLKLYRLHRTTGEWVECAAGYDAEHGLLLSSIKTLNVQVGDDGETYVHRD